jgi:acyl carrier protein
MFEQLKQILVTKFHVPGNEVVPETTFDDLGLDSLDLVELAAVVQDEFGVSLAEEELAEVHDLESVVRLAESRSAVA